MAAVIGFFVTVGAVGSASHDLQRKMAREHIAIGISQSSTIRAISRHESSHLSKPHEEHLSVSNRHPQILTADMIIAQGMSSATIRSITLWYRESNQVTSAKLKDIEYVSRKTGENIRMLRLRPANDNRHSLQGWAA
ncbi:hypothetical protein ACWF50_13525 [Brucella pseudogrignonensis]|jgi:hypothetical protein